MNISEEARNLLREELRAKVAEDDAATYPDQLPYPDIANAVQKALDGVTPEAVRPLHMYLGKDVSDLAVGQRFRKTKGLPFGDEDAVIVSVYQTTNGTVRVVGEHPEGWQHIFNPDQIEVVA